MPVSTSLTNATRAGPPRAGSVFDSASRWSPASKKRSLYERANENADPQMMKTDNIKWSPTEMLVGSSRGFSETDTSMQRVRAAEDWKVVVYSVSGIVVFLALLTFLRNK